MSDAASSVVYTERHDRMMRLLKAGDVSVVDEAIDFLEADLDDLFAGYERERIYGHLAHYDLTDAQADRLRRFVLSRCRGKRRRHEFRKLRVLARSRAAKMQLTGRLRSSSSSPSRKPFGPTSDRPTSAGPAASIAPGSWLPRISRVANSPVGGRRGYQLVRMWRR